MSEFIASQFFKQLNSNDEFFYSLTEIIRSGANKLAHKKYAESMTIESEWINTIDSFLYSVEKVVQRPKLFIKEDGVIVPVEKAKKIGSETIRHLSANSNFIRSIDEDGNVTPIKVLTKEIDEDIFIYENRFVNTLINRLLEFTEQKYAAISAQVDAYDTTSLGLDSEFDISTANVNFSLNLKIKNKAKVNLVQKQNHELLAKLEHIRKRILIIKASPFSRALASAKPVRPPIMKTNILKMDVDYKNCYSLWLFISSFTSVGYSVQFDEKNLPVDTDYYDDLVSLIAVSLKTVLENNAWRDSLYRKILYKKKFQKSFRVKKMDTPEISYGISDIVDNEELVNQYYYERLKALVRESEQKRERKLTDEITRKRSLNFRSFYRELNNLNNSLYKEMLKIDTELIPDTKAEGIGKAEFTLRKKESEAKKQNELYKKHKLLSRLKLADLDKTLKEESAQLVKLEKLKYEISAAKAKAANRKPRKYNPKSLENLKNAKSAVIESATLREMKMLSDLRTKQAEAQQAELDKTLAKNRAKEQKKGGAARQKTDE